jgi:hypothetical protein
MRVNGQSGHASDVIQFFIRTAFPVTETEYGARCCRFQGLEHSGVPMVKNA